jgi:small subunit ribosomal protein S24e
MENLNTMQMTLRSLNFDQPVLYPGIFWNRNLFKIESQNTSMEIQILEEKDNPLLNRKEIQLRIIQDAGSPNMADLRKKIAAQLSQDESLFVVQNVYAEYGMNESRCLLKVYTTKERLQEVEATHVLRKNGLEVKHEAK